MRNSALAAVVAIVSALHALPALADTMTPSAKASDSPLPSWVSAVKAGLETHDSYMAQDNSRLYHIWENRKEPGMDVNFEVLFNGPDVFHYIGSPRIQLGTNISTAGETSYAYSGLDWMYKFQNDIFIEGNFGLAIHNGTLDKSQADSTGNITPASTAEYERTKRFGSRVLFHFGPEVGYMFDEHNSISASWTHISNGQILTVNNHGDNANEGEDNWGIRYGYRFN